MKKLVCLPLFMLLALVGAAQDTTEISEQYLKPSADYDGTDVFFGLQVGFPSAEMRPAIKNRMRDIGFGASLLWLTDPYTWGRREGRSTLRLGGSLGYTYYGRFKTQANLNTFNGNIKTSYGILDVKAIGRFRPHLDRGIHPFADVQAGLELYLSSIREDLSVLERDNDDEDIDNTISAGFTKGIGGGMAIGSRDLNKAKLVIRATYNWGTRIKYVVRNSVEYDPAQNTIHYQTAKAPLRYVQIQVGIGL